MTKLPANVVAFAAGDTSLFDNYLDYWNQYRTELHNGTKRFPYAEFDKDGKTRLTLQDKEKRLNAAILRKVSSLSGVDITSMPLEQAATHPVVCWAVGAVASQLIEAVLPQTMVEGTGAYAEIRTLGWGETGIFDIRSRDLFPVSRAGRMGMREGEMHKGTEGQVTLNPEMHQITVGISLFRVLAGQESLAVFTTRALRSIETEMTKDIYTAFNTAMQALTVNASTGLRVTGYTQKDLAHMSQVVSAYSGGAAPIVMGTKVALSQIFPDDGNYRFLITDDQVTLGYLRTISGVNTFEIPQIAAWDSPFSTYISDTNLFIVAPGTDKIVKCVLGGSTVSNVTGQWDTATLQQDATIFKMWRAGVVTSSVGALITL
jgi:hypothetical protein